MESQSLKKGRFVIQEVHEAKPTAHKPICRHDSINTKKHFYSSEKNFLHPPSFTNILSFAYNTKRKEWVNLSNLFNSISSSNEPFCFNYVDLTSDSNNSNDSISKQKTNDDSIVKSQNVQRYDYHKFKSGMNLQECMLKFDTEKVSKNRFSSNNLTIHVDKRIYEVCTTNAIAYRMIGKKRKKFSDLRITLEFSISIVADKCI